MLINDMLLMFVKVWFISDQIFV